ncbi:S-layer homology domain-containing protein [Oscillospiraceae bacterium PP1C4]
MKTRKPAHRLAALVLSVLMVFAMAPISAAAQTVGTIGTNGEIISFETLSEEISMQRIALGTSLEDLNLPKSLNATVRVATETDAPKQETTELTESDKPVLDSGTPAQGDDAVAQEGDETLIEANSGSVPEAQDGDTSSAPAGNAAQTEVPTGEQQLSFMNIDIPVPVQWTSSPVYDGDTAGHYTFTTEIEGFAVSTALPQITVTVGAPTGPVTAFDPLADVIRWQTVEYGTAQEQLNLPKSLFATMEGKAAQVPVEWDAQPAYDANTKGLYLFTARLAEGFSTTAELPHLAVVVRAPEMQMARSFGGGAQEADPFLIGTAAQLAEIATLTNAGQLEAIFLGTSSGTVYLKLDNDIDLSGYKADGGWTPIGNDTNNFKGNFDGGNHVITDLTINRSGTSSQGLFGFVSGAMVQNLGVVDASVSGKDYVGGVAGYINGGTVQSCYVTGNVTGSVSGTSNVGGVTGRIYGSTVQSCYNTGSVIGTGQYVGGVAGDVTNGGRVQNCYGIGSVSGAGFVGGVVGLLDGSTAQSCYSTVSVTGTGQYVGGVAGRAITSTLQNCAALNPSVSGGSNAGRVAGNIAGGSPSGNIAFSGLMVNGSTTTGGSADNNNGADTTVAALKADTGGVLSALFTVANGWAYTAGKLPILTGFAADVQDDTMPTHIADGTDPNFRGMGTAENPYQISTPAQLAKLTELVNDTVTNATYGGIGVYYKLMNNLNLSGYNADGGWVPIGVDSIKPFKGIFNGNGNQITGLTINRTGSFTQGLFGYIGGMVENLGVVNVSVSGKEYVGGVAGYVGGGTVEDCYVTGSISGNDAVGGVTGYVNYGGRVQSCYATGQVTATGSTVNAGGLVGRVQDGTVTNCAALNSGVTATSTAHGIGRITGHLQSGALSGNIAFSGMTVTVGGTPKSITDNASDIDGAGKDKAALQTADAFPAGLIADPWTYKAGKLPGLGGTAADMPEYLQAEGATPFEGAGTSETDPYLIKTAQDLARLAELTNAGNNFSGKHFRLESNLDLSGIDPNGDNTGWIPVGSDTKFFNGNFNGNGKIVASLKINRTNVDCQGLFGTIGSGGMVRNLGVVNGSVSGKSYIGGVAGQVAGTVQNCYSTGGVSGTNTVGGVVGYVPGTVENCYSTGSISGTGDNVGGVAGFIFGTVKNCYNTASVSGSTSVGGVAGQVASSSGIVQCCYSTGSVTGNQYVGGVAGKVYGSKVQNCAALNPSVSGTSSVGHVAGSVESSGMLKSNYAYTGIPGTWNNKGLNAKDGADLTSATLFGGSFWTAAANWDTSVWDSGVWTFADGKLPTLKNIAGQSGAPGRYLLNLSTDVLSVILSGTAVSDSSGAYTALASFNPQTVTVTVAGMESWTDPAVTITVKKAANNETISVASGAENGSGTFNIPAVFSGGIIITAQSVSNPNNKQNVILTVNKRDLTAADFTIEPSGRTTPYSGMAQSLPVTAPSALGTVTLKYDGATTAPTNVGTYAVTADVTAGTLFNAATDISLGDFTIASKFASKLVTITGITATTRAYDSTTAVALTGGSLSGVTDADVANLSFTLGSGTTADANAGENKPVTITGFALTGTATSNYTLTQPTDVTVNITKKQLGISSSTVTNKEYDGNIIATVTDVVFSGLVDGESLVLGTDYTAIGIFNNADIGNGKTITVTPMLNSTEKANNYSLFGTVNATANITAKQIDGTVSIDVTQGSGDVNRIDEGDTLTANTGGITPHDATLSYQWYRNGTEISSATGKTYKVAAIGTDPIGSLITVRVTGTDNHADSKMSGSVEIGRIPLGGSVSIDGTTVLGETLTLNTASLTPSDASTSIVWLQEGSVISGVGGSSYTITRSDLGKAISVQVTGTGNYNGTITTKKVVPAVVPDAPMLTATAGNGQITLNWTVPFNGGSTITKYQISNNNGANWTDVDLVTTHTVTGLTNGTAYTFKLRAVNGIGNGAESSVPGTPAVPNSGGGGSSSNDNSSPVIVTPPTPDKPKSPTQGEIKVLGIVDNKGNVTVNVTNQNVTDAFNKALANAKKNRTAQNGITVVLRVDTGSKTTSNVKINLPKAVQDAIIAKKIVDTIVVVGNPDIRIGMDLATVQEFNRQAKSDINITATRTDSGKLTGDAKKAIGSRPVFDLKVNYGSGKAVSSFGAGSVSVTIPYTLGANEKAGNVQAVYVDSKGKVHWLVNSVYDSVEKVLRFSTDHFSTYGIGYKQTSTAFSDIAGHWAKEDIEFVVSRGLFSGTSTTTFSPSTAMTRGMFVTALGRLANADVSGYAKSSFTDVKSDAYYMGYIEFASKNNILNGVGNNKFAPDQSITREQMAVIMRNYAKAIGCTLPKVHVENTFADNAKISAYAKDAVKQMQMAGVICGKNGNLFDPQGTVTRAEVSAMLRRLVELTISSDTAQGWTMNDSGKWIYYEKGKPVTRKKDIDGSTYTFYQYSVTADVPKNLRYTTYTVQKGDSFWLIAHKLGCTMSELERLNNKSRFAPIHPGDVLRVPEE